MKDLVLLHGALGSEKNFSFLLPLLEEHFNCHPYTFSGHGGTNFRDSFGIETFAFEVQAFIKERGLKDPYVFGYSMGGYVALFLEANHPASFCKIMTLAVKFDWNAKTAEKEAGFLNPAKMQEKVPKYVEYLKKEHGENWQKLAEKTAKMMLQLGSLPMITDAGFQSIEVPVQLAIGEIDNMVSIQETLNTFRKIPHASYVILPGTPHPLEKVNPDRLVNKITRFMEQE